MEENRAENQTPRRQHTQHPTHQAHKKKKSGTAKTVIGTILAIGLTTCLMFFAIFMVYVHVARSECGHLGLHAQAELDSLLSG